MIRATERVTRATVGAVVGGRVNDQTEVPAPGATLVTWLESVGPTVRRASVELLANLLREEADPARASDIIQDLGVLTVELVSLGDYPATAVAAEALAAAELRQSALSGSCRAALDLLADCPALWKAVNGSATADDLTRSAVQRITGVLRCAAIGDAAGDAKAGATAENAAEPEDVES